jgi:LPS O-antigen subunit length determinant protein (WzzB/FepE family)
VAEQTDIHYEDEIDLIELIVKLWNEKALIIITTTITTILGLSYALLSTPVYTASAQLYEPSPAELSYLNQTPYYKIEPTEVFTEYLSNLASITHLNNVRKENTELILEATGLKNDESFIFNIGKIRNIEFPNTKRKNNEIAPDQYFLTYKGIDRNKMQNLILADLNEANIITTKEINERYKNQLQLKIQELSWKQELDLEQLEDQLSSRKSYVLASRTDNLIKLEEAFKIANNLNIEKPTTLAKLAIGSAIKQVEINAELNNSDKPLYLRGTRLLGAEIQNLKNLSNNIYLDKKVRELNAKKIIIENNRELNQLRNIYTEVENLERNIKLFSQLVNSPKTPIKPKKILIVTISILIGGILGIFLSMGRIIYKNHRLKKS